MDFFAQIARNIIASVGGALSIFSSNPALPSPTPIPAPEVTIQESQGNYTASDSIEIFQGQKISYNFQIPKNGGPITGNYSGICSGPVIGTYTPNSNPSLSGTLTGTCKLGLFNIGLNASYTGKVSPDTKTLELNYTIQSPTQTSGSKVFPLQSN